MMGIFSRENKFKSKKWGGLFFGTTFPALILFIIGEEWMPWLYLIAFGLFFIGLLALVFGTTNEKKDG